MHHDNIDMKMCFNTTAKDTVCTTALDGTICWNGTDAENSQVKNEVSQYELNQCLNESSLAKYKPCNTIIHTYDNQAV